MPFDLSAAWNSALALMKHHQSMIVPLAGVFIFLPTLLLGYFFPPPTFDGISDPDAMLEVLSGYFNDNSGWLFLGTLVSSIGTLALTALFVKPAGLSVGEALKMGAMALVPVLVASIFYGFAIGFGLLLLVIPGLYLLARFSLVQPVIIAENTYNPFTAIGRSWELTKGNGWRLLGFIVVLILVALIVAGIISGLFGVIFNLALPGEVGRFLTSFVDATVDSAIAVMFAAVYAAIYRQLTGPIASELAATFD